MIRTRMAIGLLILSMLVACLPMINLRPAYCTDLDNALDLAEAYIDRSYTELNSSMAVVRDLPGLPFSLHDATDNKWGCPAKETPAIQEGNDGPDWGYYFGCIEEAVNFGYNTDPSTYTLRYKWDTNADEDYDGMVMNASIIAVNDTFVQLKVYVESKMDGDIMHLYLDTEKIIDTCAVGSYATKTKEWGWFTSRFVIRHATKMASGLYQMIGETSKAEKLNNTYFASGFTKDPYDGFFNQSNTYPDYMPLEYNLTGNDEPWCATHAVFPDNYVWGNIPWARPGGLANNHSAVPYRSQLHLSLAVNTMLDCPFGGSSIWQLGFTFKFSWANHLMNKYGNNQTSLAIAKQILDETPWNGMGINQEVNAGLVINRYACYVAYLAGMYLRALSRYYEITQDEKYGKRADDVAGILLNLQVKQGDKIYVSNGTARNWVKRPDHIGGFLCGYKYGSSWDWANAPWTLSDQFYTYAAPIGYYHRDLGEYSAMGWTNIETTCLVYAGLWYYKRLNRTPTSSDVEFNFIDFEAKSVSKTESAQGTKSIIYDKEGNVRLWIVGSIYGETWYNVTYTWEMNITSYLNDFKAKIAVYYPYWDSGGGNALEIWIAIYHDGQRIEAENNYTKPTELDGLEWSGEKYVVIENLSRIALLEPGDYDVNLTLRFSCGAWGNLGVGMNTYNQPHGHSFSIDTFGFSGNLPIDAMKTRENGYFYMPYLPTHHIRIESIFENNNPNCSGDQTGATSPYIQFNNYPDEVVDGSDLALIASRYGTWEGSSGWLYMCDIVPDGVIDGSDLTIVSRNYGRSGPLTATLTNVTVKFSTGQELTPDDYGFIAIPYGATSFNVTRNGNPNGALIVFYE